MKKAYEVAGHIFTVELPDRYPLWDLMGQYNPFEIPVPESGAIFSLEWVPGLPEREKTPVYTEIPEENGQARIELYHIEGGWRFEMAPTAKAPTCCWLETDEDYTRATLSITPERRSALFAINNSLMILYAFRTASMGTLEMHSSVVIRDGKGYMFLGKSGTGKSTHARLWLKHIEGSELMNDDNPVVRFFDDGPDGAPRAVVYGSPWSGKTPCYRNVQAPVGGIVLLSQAPFNKIVRLKGVQAYAALVTSISGKRWDKSVADGLHATENALAKNVPVWHLECLPDEAAAKLCSENVAGRGWHAH